MIKFVHSVFGPSRGRGKTSPTVQQWLNAKSMRNFKRLPHFQNYHKMLSQPTEGPMTPWLPLQEYVVVIVVNVRVLFCTTNDCVIRSGQKKSTSLLLNTSAASSASVVTLEVAGLLLTLCFE